MNSCAPILHVEDDPNDVLLFDLALRRKKAGMPVHSVGDGQEALKYLEGSGAYADRARFPMPGLIILDLKLPGISGFDLLEWMRAQPAYKRIPVFVLSSSFLAQDRARAEALGADRYFVKRHDFLDIAEAVSEFVRRCEDGQGSGAA